MIKTIVNKFLKAALSELFVNAPSVQLSMGADMFSDSNINLNNLTFRPDIFDVCLQPLKLVSGHLGLLKVEGIAELALGGKLKFHAENCFLLFQVDTTSDAEYLQSLKKILIELQGDTFPATIIRELLKRIQGFPVGAELDLKKKRRVMYKAIDYVFKGLHGLLKNIHFRIEIAPPDGSANKHSAIGLVIPHLKFTPSVSSSRPDGVSKIDPLVLLGLKSLQVYVDYDRSSYSSKGATDAQIAKLFVDRWSVEVHTSVVLPFDLDISLAIGIRRKIGLLSPKITCKTPLLRLVCDYRQLEVLRDLVALMAYSSKRGQQLVRLQKIFRKGFPLPRMFEVGGVRLLPHLLIRNKLYPAETSLPVSPSCGLVAFMKERVGVRWPTMLWKHLIRLVLHDLKVVRPSGRWVEMAKLAFIRREYAFMYSKLLHRSKETGQFAFNVNAKITSDKLRQLFEYEMYLPVHAVLMFRTLGVMIATAELFNSKRKQARQTSQGKVGGAQPFEKIGIQYGDILRIFVQLFELQRETASHRFDRHRLQDEDNDLDDSVSARASEDGYAPSVHSRLSGDQYRPPSPAVTANRNAGGSTPKQQPSLTSMFSRQSTTSSSASSNSFQSPPPSSAASSGSALMRSSVKSVVSLQSSAMKLFSNMGSSLVGGAQADEYDNKFLGKFDLSVFGDFFGGMAETEDRLRADAAPSVDSPIPSNENAREVFDWGLGGTSPSYSLISDAVQWVMLRHQETLTLMPPDVNLVAEKLSVDLRTPMLLPHTERKNIVSANVAGLSLSLNISQSSSMNAATGGSVSESDSGNARKISSLSGALLQLRVVARQVSAVLHLENAPNDEQPAVSASSNGKGLLLEAGLPAYPIHENPALVTPTRGFGDEGSVRTSSYDGEEQQNDEMESEDDDKFESSSSVSAQNSVTPHKAAGSVIPLPGETILAAMKRQQQQAADDMYASPPPPSRINPVPHLPKDGAGSSLKPVAKTPSEEVRLAAAGGGSNPYEKVVLLSAKGDNALVFCLILDFDDQGEGAADVQVQVGGMGVDLSKTVLSALILPRISDNIGSALSAWSETRQYLPIFAERAVIVDREHKVSLVAFAVDSADDSVEVPLPAAAAPQRPPLNKEASVGSTSSAVLPTVTEHDDDVEQSYLRQLNGSVVSGEDSSGEDGESDSHHGNESPEQQQQNATAPTKADAKKLSVARQKDAAHRRAMLENKNIQQWIGITEAQMPKVLSICVRTSAIKVNLLEASVLRDLVYSKIHNVIDLAANRDRLAATPLSFATDTLLGLLGNILLGGNAAFNPYNGVRRWGSKKFMHKAAVPVLSAASELQSTLSIPSTELVIAKASVPYPCLEVHLQGFELKVPMTDETMCHLSAVVLAHYMPFYC